MNDAPDISRHHPRPARPAPHHVTSAAGRDWSKGGSLEAARLAYEEKPMVGFHRYRDILYTNILYTLQSLYVTKFIQTLFIRNKIYTGQSLYSNKIYTLQNLYRNKIYTNTIYTVTKFICNKIYTFVIE
jgi:hypothetical protein